MTGYTSFFKGVGSFLPEKTVKNDDLKAFMETSDEWIKTRTGIEERHWVTGQTTTSDLALNASKEALKNAGLDAADLDMILVATLSPDHEFPGVSCFLQEKLGISGCAVLDIRQQCSGFIYGVSIADQFIKSGMYKNILVVGAEIHSKGLDLSDEGRDVSVLFGDGAGAAVISRATAESDGKILSTHLHGEGKYAKALWAEAPSMAFDGPMITAEVLEKKLHFPKMNGKLVFVNAIKRMPEAISEALTANNLKISDIDLFMFHQANLRINEAVAKQLEIPEHKVFNTIQKYGNTTAATIPIGLADAVAQGKLKKGMLVASAAFGSGFTWGAFITRW